MAWTLQQITACDGSAWARARRVSGLDGLLAYWREHATVSDAAAARSGLRTLTVDRRVGDWPARRRRIAEFVGLTWPPSAAPIETDLVRFVGRYRSEAGREACLSLRDGVLVVERLLWLGNRLLPRAPDIFGAESWPFRLTFEAAPSGAVVRFRLAGPDLPWSRPAGVYEKLA